MVTGNFYVHAIWSTVCVSTSVFHRFVAGVRRCEPYVRNKGYTVIVAWIQGCLQLDLAEFCVRFFPVVDLLLAMLMLSAPDHIHDHIYKISSLSAMCSSVKFNSSVLQICWGLSVLFPESTLVTSAANNWHWLQPGLFFSSQNGLCRLNAFFNCLNHRPSHG